MVASRVSDIRRAIEKLADIHGDISKMLAVHEERLNQHEKKHDTFGEDIEKRRIEIHEVTSDLYQAIDMKTNNIMHEIRKNAENSAAQHNRLNDKITSLSRYIWIGIGASVGISIIISIATLAINFLQLIK